jgi:uncharacterized integral membrane protein
MLNSLWRLILGLVLVILVVVVALQNRRPVHIHVLWWTLPHVPLAIVVLAAILVGVILGLAATVWGALKLRRRQPSEPTISSPPPSTDSPSED